jgi:hypothetical protein
MPDGKAKYQFTCLGLTLQRLSRLLNVRLAPGFFRLSDKKVLLTKIKNTKIICNLVAFSYNGWQWQKRFCGFQT